MDRRRLLLTSLAGALARPLVAGAQPTRNVWRIGLLGPATTGQAVPFVAVFRQRMRERGWAEGEHFTIDQRWAAGQSERFPDLAADLVRSNPDVIVVWTTPAVIAAKRATSSIPIVMASSADAVGAGLVASLAHPGGNVTGVSTLANELLRKHPELLREVAPRISRIGVLFDPTSAADVLALRELHTTVDKLGLHAESLEARTAVEIDSSFASLQKRRVEGLVVMAGSVNWVNRKRIFQFAAASRIPAIYVTSEFTKDGGLMSYGVDLLDLTRQATDYVDKILRGRAPADLPVEQPTKFAFIINLKTARALGLTIPPSLLARADQIIE